ncbi:hypothetical protein ACFWJ2_02845 [Streptomyces tendae]|uniref:hypothetical protein n=1 Tax=Streptomyces tendae TaxID=1932 RepID=UPI0036551ECB
MWLYDHTVEKDPARGPWVPFDFEYQHLIRDAWTQYLWEKAAGLVSGFVGREGSGERPSPDFTRLRRRIGTRLPVGVITTHYPDRSGRILLNVAFASAAHTALRAVADRAARTPQRFLDLAVHQDLAQHAAAEADRLERALRHLFAHTAPARLIAAVGHCLIRTSGAAPC